MPPKPQHQPKIAFFAHAHNLAEVSRAVEIAAELRNRNVETAFFTHGGPHGLRIPEREFTLNILKPIISDEKHEFLIGIEQGRTFRPPFNTEELSALVAEEVKALRVFKPDAVYCGMNMPSVISARALGLPLIMVLPTPVTRTWFRRGFGTYPDSHENMLTRRIPRKFKDRFFNWLMLRARYGLGAFNNVGGRYGLRPFRRAVGDLFSGDLTLLTDVPELTGIPESDFPAGCFYIGPLFARLPIPVPEDVRHVFSKPGLNVYLAMGSSAPPSIFRRAAFALIQSKYNVVIATTSIIDPATLGPLPPNVCATRYLPAAEINRMADVAVIHGGQGTVQTACRAGTPIVGVALQFEQQANLDMVVRAGMGLRIPLHAYTTARILRDVDIVARSSGCRDAAKHISALMRGSDGAANAANRILSLLKGPEGDARRYETHG